MQQHMHVAIRYIFRLFWDLFQMSFLPSIMHEFGLFSEFCLHHGIIDASITNASLKTHSSAD